MTDNLTTERVDHPPRVREAIDELMREKDAIDNRTTELLDGLRNVGNLHEFAELFGFNWHDESDWTWHDVAVKMADWLEQAIVATLGNEACEWQGSVGQGWCQGAYDATIDEYDGFFTTWHILGCGHGVLMADDEKPSYCPECGAKVVER